jgi:hypothetical protein
MLPEGDNHVRRFNMRLMLLGAAVLITMLAMTPVHIIVATTPTPSPLPPTPIAGPKGEQLAWPVAMPTAHQVSEVSNCDVVTLPKERYAKSLKTDQLRGAFKIETTCDLAVLTAAYVQYLEDNQAIPEAGISAFRELLTENPAFAFIDPFYFKYIAIGNLVETPTFSRQPITHVEIKHSWTGLGEPVRYTVSIEKADTATPVVSGTTGKGYDERTRTLTPDPLTARTIDTKLVQALGDALTDLLPVEALVSQVPCWDNYPDWTVTLTFKDGTQLELTTNKSNFFYGGGPWQTTIEKQRYMQYSAAFLTALYDVVEALDLPRGQTAAMGCGGMNAPLGEFFPSFVKS